MAMILSISGWSQETVTIGTGTLTQDYTPFAGWYNYASVQSIYTSDDIGMEGSITSVSYYATSQKSKSVKIYMGERESSTFSGTSDWTPINNMTLVYDGTVNFTANAWTTIELDVPYTYTGSNLVIGVLSGNTDSYAHFYTYASSVTGSRTIYRYNDDNAYTDFSGSGSSYQYIPNIQLSISPIEGDFCYAPATITVGDISVDGATVSWTMNENNPDASVNLQYALASADWDDEEAVTTISGLSGEEYTLTDLAASTAYKVRIQADCGSSTSSWKSASFRTACDIISDLPTTGNVWFEDFESYTGGGEQPFNCWATPVVNNGPFVYCGHSPSCHSGYNSAELKGSTNVVVLPEFAEDIHNLRLTFWTTATTTSNGYVRVGVMTDVSDTNTFELVGVCDTPASRGASGSTGNGNIQGPFDFTNVEAESGRIAIIYVSTTSTTASWNLDDFTVSIRPNCSEPTSFAVSNPLGHSIDLSWVSDAETVTVAYKTNEDEDWTTTTASENPFTLTGLSPETAYTVKVGVDCGGGDMSWSFERTFTTSIACPAPAITVGATTAEEVTLTWTGAAESYTVKYGLFGTEEQTWEETTATENTVTLQDLAPASSYSVKIVAYCGEQDGYSQPGTTTFRTECVALTVTNTNSFTEDFETLSSSDFGCWTEEIVTGSSHWTIASYGGSKVAYRSYTVGSNRLISPVLDITGLNSPYLSYNWEAHYYSSYNDSIYVYYRTSSDAEWVQLAAHGSNEGSSISAVTQINTIALPEASETYQIAFLGVGNDGYGMAIDNVVIQNIECAAPSNVAVTNITANSATISWESDGDVIAYKTAGDEDWTVVSATENPTTITNLVPATLYTIKVGLTCESGEASYSQQTSFRTECTVVTEFAYNESFEGLTDNDFGCWTNDGFIVNDYGAQHGNDFAYMSAGYSATTGGIVSPIFDLTNIEHPFVTFYYVINGSSANLSVYYRTSAEEEWTQLGSSYTESENGDWAFETLALPNPSATYQIRFGTSLSWFSNVGLDNISVLNIDCAAPSGIVVDNVTGHTAQVSWLGDATVVEYKTATDEEWTPVGVSESPETITNLTPETVYTLRAGLDCGTGETSYSQNVTFTTDIACPAPIITVTEVTTTTATVSWVGDAENYTLRYRLSGSEEYSEEIPVADNTYSLTDLTASTTYVVEVQANCGEDDGDSQWGTKSFNTACDIITDLPTADEVWFEDFESYTNDGQNEFVCWATPITDATYNGPFVYGYYSRSCHSGGYSAEMKGASNMVVLPEFAEDIHNLRLTFWTTATSTSVGTLEVGVVTDAADPTTFELVGTCVTPAARGNQDGVAGNGNLQGPFDFSGVEAESGRIALRYTSTSPSQSWNLDDFTVQLIPACAEPTGVTVSNVAGHSATLAWASTSESVVVAYKTAADEGFTEITGVSENPYVLSGLAPETQYTVKVGVTCEDNSISWSTTKTFTTDIACPAPVVTISNITETSVTISYTGDAEEYELKYKTLSDEDWTTETITENPYTLENLSPSTTYTVELRANCGDEDGMSSAGTTSFTTACVTITDFPYTESFEGNSLGCWLSNPVDAEASNWTTSEYYYSSSTAPADGSYCAYLYLENNDAYHHAQLLSPTFDLSSIGNPTLTFSHIQKVWISDQDTLGLYYRTSTAGEWTYLTSWSSNINTWQNETITLPEPSAEYQLMFLGAIHYGYGVGIDNITIDGDGETPEPVQPTVVTNAATSISQTSAILNGEITSEGNQTITARGFEWKLATATDYTVVSATGTTMTATLTGLTANTTYTYKAFATTALGTVYGSELTFTTLEQGEEPCTPTASTTEATICAGETYEFNGQTYTTAGTYTATLVNAAGCDSTATLVLTVNQPTSSTTDVTVCYGETYEFNGQTYNATGTYTATLTNAAGCDSVATLNLTVRPANAPIEETVTLNNDELPYTWRGEQYTEFGTYTVAGEDENGCPQEYVLTLVHNSGIAEVENEYSIALYPNPTSENATLSVKGLNEEATVIVTDQAGRVISTTKLALGQETMEVETTKLASGVYYIRIQTANSVRTEKLIRK